MKKLLSALGRLWQGLRNALTRGSKALAATLRKPKWRHGRWSLLMMAGFLAVLVLVNVGVEALENTYGWRRDYSYNGYATTGEETQAAVERIQYPVDIYLLYQRGAVDSQMLEVLNRYGVLSDQITIHPTDIAQNPGILTRFQGDMDTALQADCVIVSCEATNRYRVMDYNDFITQAYNVEEGRFELAGLAYEKKLTEALMYVTEDTVPLVGILQGHGELTAAELSLFVDFLRSNNYDSKALSLIGGDSLEGMDLLLIASPQKDFSEEEVAAIDAFAKDGGSLLITRDFTDPLDLPRYKALLRNYGVVPLDGIVVAGEEDAGSYFQNQLYLLPYMEALDMTLPLIAGDMDTLLLLGSSAFETPPEATQSLSVATVLKTGPTAYVRHSQGGDISLEKQATDITGELAVALYAHRMHATGNVSRLVALGCSALLADEYAYQDTYGGEFLLQVMGELLPQKTVALDIMASTAFHPGLRPGSQTLGIALIVATPMLVLALALLVLLPRKNR